MADAPSADLLARLRLIRSDNVGPISFRQLLARFGTAQDALRALPDLARRGGGEPGRIASVAEAEREWAALAKLGGRFLFAGVSGSPYPPLLAEVDDAPPVVACLGDPALAARPCVAIVGARNASAAGQRFAAGLAAELGEAGAVVVSGLARGIDTAAHRGSLATGTIAAIAGGLDVAYPPENAPLQAAIGAQGLILAEQPVGTQPMARHFPRRNRLISGTALGVVVIEAAPRSGSLITARMAGEQGREVMAVPGSPLDPRAQGCNGLIREGATLVQCAADVLEAVGGMAAAVPARRCRPAPSPAPQPLPDPCADDERAVAALLSATPAPVDDLVRLTGLAPAAVQTVLLDLELAGRLVRHAGNRVALA